MFIRLSLESKIKIAPAVWPFVHIVVVLDGGEEKLVLPFIAQF